MKKNKISMNLCKGITRDEGFYSVYEGIVIFEKNKKKNRISLSRNRRRNRKKTRPLIRVDKKNGVISMETFLSRYLGIEGEALSQMKHFTHDDLDKMKFPEVKRVPFEIVNGNSEFFWVIDEHGVKLPYVNPLEEIILLYNSEGETIPYRNLSSGKNVYHDFDPEYDDELDDFDEISYGEGIEMYDENSVSDNENVSGYCKRKQKRRK